MSSSKRPHNKRAKSYQWIGAELADGRPLFHLGDSGIPPRDLGEAETLELTAEQVEAINSNDDLYKPIDEPTSIQTRTKPRVKKPKAEDTSTSDPVVATDAATDDSTETDSTEDSVTPADDAETQE